MKLKLPYFILGAIMTLTIIVATIALLFIRDQLNLGQCLVNQALYPGLYR